MTDEKLQELASEIRDQILGDARDRGGWGNVWDDMNTAARWELRETWRKMIFNRLRDFRDNVQ